MILRCSIFLQAIQHRAPHHFCFAASPYRGAAVRIYTVLIGGTVCYAVQVVATGRKPQPECSALPPARAACNDCHAGQNPPLVT